MGREMLKRRSNLSRYSRLKKERQMEQRTGQPIWVLEDMDWGLATVWVPTVPMVCPMAWATMAAMLVMAHTGYGRDLWMLVGQDQRDPQNRFMDLVMDWDMVVMALATVDLEATAFMAMVSMAMVSMVDTFGRDLPKTPLQNQSKLGPRDLQALTMALAWDHTMALATAAMVWEGCMGMVSMVAISGKGLLRIPIHQRKPEKRGHRVPTMDLALVRTMALVDMAWEVSMVGMVASMGMASGGVLWRKNLNQRKEKAK